MRLPDYKIYMGIKGAHMKNQALAAPKNDPKNQPMIEHDNIQVDMWLRNYKFIIKLRN